MDPGGTAVSPEDRVFGDWRDYPVAFIGGALPWWQHVIGSVAILVLVAIVNALT